MEDYMERCPSNAEVMSALTKVLKTSYFCSAKTQSAFLRLVVENAIRHVSMNEIQIGIELIENFDPKSHTIRATGSIVRNKLDTYYLKEGKNDIIRIDLPPGNSYPCRFSYHSRSDTLTTYKRASGLISRLTRTALWSAHAVASGIVSGEDAFAPACVLQAECETLMVIADQIWTAKPKTTVAMTSDFYSALQSLSDAIELDPDSVSAYVVSGGLMLLLGIEDGATHCFETAYSKDPGTVSMSLWYALYIWLTNNDADGSLRIIDDRIKLAPQESAPRCVGALIAYWARRYPRAQAFVDELVDLDDKEDYAFVLEGLIELAQENYHDAARKFRMIAQADSARRPIPKDENERSNRELFVGFSVLCLLREGKAQEAQVKFDSLRKRDVPNPLEMCIAHMGFGDMEAAALWLGKAVGAFNIFAIHSRTLPLFDPLRKYQTDFVFAKFVEGEVQRLIEELGTLIKERMTVSQ
jgi:tetratricopeptide (TPR) repeat protein